MKLLTLGFGVVGVVLSTGSCATQFGCPPSIRVDENIEAAPDSWAIGSSEEQHWLDRVTIFDGPPAEMAALVNDEEQKQGSKRVAVWKLDARSPRAYWVTCSYNRTTVTLSRQIPERLAECRVVYETQVVSSTGLPHIESFSCQ